MTQSPYFLQTQTSIGIDSHIAGSGRPGGEGATAAGTGRGRLGWPWPGSGELWGTQRWQSFARTRVHRCRSTGLDRQDGAEWEGAYPLTRWWGFAFACSSPLPIGRTSGGGRDAPGVGSAEVGPPRPPPGKLSQ